MSNPIKKINGIEYVPLDYHQAEKDRRLGTPTPQNDDLRTEISTVMMKGWMNTLKSSSGRYPGLIDTSTVSVKPEILDDLVNMFTAEKKKLLEGLLKYRGAYISRKVIQTELEKL